MKILGIETSGRSGSISLVDDGTELAGTELSATGRRHARTLVPEIGQLLQQVNLKLTELDGIAVSIGPGSFTGLRVGVVCAKTLAYALSKPLIAVDTFEAIAAGQLEANQVIWVIDDALRGDVYAGKYSLENGGLLSQQKPTLVSMEQFKENLRSEETVTGPGVNKLQEELTKLKLGEEKFRLPAAVQIALIGERKLQQQESDNLWTIEPHYIRRSAAEEKADA